MTGYLKLVVNVFQCLEWGREDGKGRKGGNFFSVYPYLKAFWLFLKVNRLFCDVLPNSVENLVLVL